MKNVKTMFLWVGFNDMTVRNTRPVDSQMAAPTFRPGEGYSMPQFLGSDLKALINRYTFY